MYYVIKGYNSIMSVDDYCYTVYNKGEKKAVIKQYKEYLNNNELDMFKVLTYLDDGTLKEIATYL